MMPFDVEAYMAEQRALDGKRKRRYLHAYEVNVDTRLRLMPKGHCNWCGQPLTGRSKFFCPQSERDWGPGKMTRYWCTLEFTARWCSVPKFKRAVFVRDHFTCQNCHLKPETTNKHGLVIPDLSLLACDHIHPFAKGGETRLENLQTLCRKCNQVKSDKVDWQPAAMGKLL
jgi:5-methylcytosine-specific restriction endonuclease McrA